jgi:hypothetical protein
MNGGSFFSGSVLTVRLSSARETLSICPSWMTRIGASSPSLYSFGT